MSRKDRKRYCFKLKIILKEDDNNKNYNNNNNNGDRELLKCCICKGKHKKNIIINTIQTSV